MVDTRAGRAGLPVKINLGVVAHQDRSSGQRLVVEVLATPAPYHAGRRGDVGGNAGPGLEVAAERLDIVGVAGTPAKASVLVCGGIGAHLGYERPVAIDLVALLARGVVFPVQRHLGTRSGLRSQVVWSGEVHGETRRVAPTTLASRISRLHMPGIAVPSPLRADVLRGTALPAEARGPGRTTPNFAIVLVPGVGPVKNNLPSFLECRAVEWALQRWG